MADELEFYNTNKVPDLNDGRYLEIQFENSDSQGRNQKYTMDYSQYLSPHFEN